MSLAITLEQSLLAGIAGLVVALSTLVAVIRHLWNKTQANEAGLRKAHEDLKRRISEVESRAERAEERSAKCDEDRIKLWRALATLRPYTCAATKCEEREHVSFRKIKPMKPHDSEESVDSAILDELGTSGIFDHLDSDGDQDQTK